MRRLRKDRPMSSVTLRIPEDVVEELKRLAPTLGFAGYQPLIRAYIGKGLRVDLARMDEGSVPRLIASLKRRGVAGGDRAVELVLISPHRSSALLRCSNWRPIDRNVTGKPGARRSRCVTVRRLTAWSFEVPTRSPLFEQSASVSLSAALLGDQPRTRTLCRSLHVL
jgi:hypothetical protein